MKFTSLFILLFVAVVILCSCGSNEGPYEPSKQIPTGFREAYYTKSIAILNLINTKMNNNEAYTEEERKYVLRFFMAEFTKSKEELVFKADFSLLEGTFQSYFEQEKKGNKQEMKKLADRYHKELQGILKQLNL
ncbi:hypothetical protein [Paenibacillus sp. MMS18-CY102]|uniref:hypothetical protein n=1 Tax=Paenibacillus sp. MMS18-CY102 TaxID=2682849 RepID=UPI00136642A5|nr:hypothetical protein [Paenibacillus sp. MMS18-CY102]MWC31170.1 hypothetical protein [Paenibacillus sp. MMS18-CY102]